MRRYLLDTNIISNAMRVSSGPLVARLSAADERALYTTIIVAAELRFGAAKKGSTRLKREVEEMLCRLVVKPIQPPLDKMYASIRSDLEAKGTPIGDADYWIAAQALNDGSVLVTDNTREFARIPGLALENWLRP